MVVMQSERQHMFTITFAVARTECHQAVCYELMHCKCKSGYKMEYVQMLRRARYCQFAVVCRLSVRLQRW